jgi:hypothetical protein
MQSRYPPNSPNRLNEQSRVEEQDNEDDEDEEEGMGDDKDRSERASPDFSGHNRTRNSAFMQSGFEKV